MSCEDCSLAYDDGARESRQENEQLRSDLAKANRVIGIYDDMLEYIWSKGSTMYGVKECVLTEEDMIQVKETLAQIQAALEGKS